MTCFNVVKNKSYLNIFYIMVLFVNIFCFYILLAVINKDCSKRVCLEMKVKLNTTKNHYLFKIFYHIILK